jgi:hypothetical protein
VIAEYDNGAVPSSPSREYIYSGSALLGKIESGTTVYYHPDHLSTRVLTDSETRGQTGRFLILLRADGTSCPYRCRKCSAPRDAAR